MGTTPAELPLAEILARGVLVEWFEAVALVRATTEHLTRARSRSTPDLGQILLGRDGSVRVSGTSYDDEPVRRLGQLLQALLNRSDPPTTLRLVVANAIAPVPIYADLPQFDQAAAYFERPDRSAVLRALFGRADSQSVPGSVVAQSGDRIAPLPEEVPIDLATSSRRIRQVIALALVAGLAFAAAFLAARLYRESHLPAGAVADAAQRATGSLDGAMLSGLSAVAEHIGLGRLTSAPRPAAAVAATPAPLARAMPGASSPHVRRRARLEPGPIQAFDLGPSPRAPVWMAVVPALLPPDNGPHPARREAALSDDALVYAEGSPGVVPPTAILPKFPKILPSGVDPSDLSRIEVTIQPDGSVESVKLIPGPADSVTDFMLLSAAKAWRFAPATRDGVPVRYRKTIWVIAD